MSILLESLSQQESSQENSLPDIHSSHFDDDMLGDEWLLKRLKKWQLASIALVTMLVVSWGYFFYYFYSASDISRQQEIIATPLSQESVSTHVADAAIVQTNNVQSNDVQSNSVQSNNAQSNSAQPNKATSSVTKSKTSQVTAQSSEAVSLSTNNAVQRMGKENIKQNVSLTSPQKNVYSPQKKQPTTSLSSVKANNNQNNNASVVSNNTQFVSASKLGDDTPVLLVSELSPELQQKFPQIAIDSYVVSDKPKDSFVILGGSFYAVNQVIAPKLILRQINQKNIVVEFYSQRVRIPFE